MQNSIMFCKIRKRIQSDAEANGKVQTIQAAQRAIYLNRNGGIGGSAATKY